MRTLDLGDVAGLGFELILGNTFHLFISPGAERIAELGGLHRFIGWDRALITDSGGFQVFSLAHGGVADEIKGRRGGAGASGGVLEIAERGVRFRSYLDGSERFMGPEESMDVQAALGSDIALAFDECTPFHADRDYTARSTERTHRWLDRCLEWHGEHGPPEPGRVRDRPGRRPRGPAPRVGAGGERRRGRRARDRGHAGPRQARDARGARDDRAAAAAGGPQAPARDRRARRPAGRDRARDRRLRLRRADAARPPRDGAGAAPRVALSLRPRPSPVRRPTRGRWSRAARARPAPSTPAPTSTTSSRAEAPTAARLLTLHNLTFLERLVAGAREAIAAGRFDAYRAAVLGGTAPGRPRQRARPDAESPRRSRDRFERDGRARSTACSRG